MRPPRTTFWAGKETMDIRGLLLVNSESIGEVDQSPVTALAGTLDVAGKSPLLRMAERLQIFCISASRRNDAASLFRTQLTRCRTECPLLEHEGYFNPLADARDLRQFAIDVLIRQTQTCPAGAEAKPGVWIAPGALIEKGARILAPAFVGSFARVRSGAVITRCSSVERHAVVDCGTVIENSTVLPFSYVGAGLDLAHSVAGMGRIVNLHRDVTVEI